VTRVLLAVLLAATSGRLVRWSLSYGGYGPIRIGMTVAEAQRASGATLIEDELPPGAKREASCFYVSNPKKLPGLRFMISDGKLARIDAGSPIAAPGGGREGMTEEQIKRLYPGIRIEDHHDVDGGLYLIQANGRFNLLFETDGKVVLGFRVGLPDPVSWVEGCL
jgi:hypothetical protein